MSVDYIQLNKEAYDTLAEEYYERLRKHDAYYGTVGNILTKFAMEELRKNRPQEEYNVLELGCGPGAILSFLDAYKDVKIYAIDISENMAKYARMSCDRANIRSLNALDIEDVTQVFDVKAKFDLILMSAFIHLFPYDDAQCLLKSINGWLVPEGYVYIDTTRETSFEDGKLREKIGYKNKVIRLRTEYTLDKFNILIKSSGYRIIKQQLHKSQSGKLWIRTVAQLE